MRAYVTIAVLLLAAAAPAADWEYVGMDGINATCITADLDHDRILVGTLEGFWYLDLGTGQWTERDAEGWIGRTVWAIDHHDTLDQRVITGRENAWFKGYMEYSEDLGATEVFAYESDGGRVTDLLHDGSAYWACTWSDIVDGEFLRSVDGGVTWAPVPGHGFHAMTSLTFDLGGELALAGDAGVKRSYDHGVTWEDMTGDLPPGYGVYDVLGVYPGGDALPWTSLLASIDLGLYYSYAVGHWEQILDTSCRDLVRIPRFTWLVGDGICAVTWDGRVMLTLSSYSVWDDVTADLPGTPLAAAYVPGEHGIYVLTAAHGLWRRHDLVTGVETPARPAPVLSAHPNPFNPGTSLSFTLPEAGPVVLKIYDITGREVATLTRGERAAGEHVVDWHAGGAPSGTYLACLETASGRSTRKIVLLK